MQTIYRSGVIHESNFAKLDYYQGLNLHGVINAVVLTTFFAVAFGYATVVFYLKREPNKTLAWTSFWLMTIGTLMAAWAMLAGKASVLYTFYPPLKGHPLFYLGRCAADCWRSSQSSNPATCAVHNLQIECASVL
jgi:cytochrome c oxidase subunit 1